MTRRGPLVLVLDGVTGAGKSSVLARLLRTDMFRGAEVVDEDQTLGTLMDDVRDPTWRAAPSIATLERILDTPREGSAPLILERFHLSWYALLPVWPLYAEIDARLADLGARLVLLTYPEHQVALRSLDRAERAGWSEGMAAWYGSREAAIDAVRSSQRERMEALGKTSLPFLHIDTRERAWDTYVAAISAWSSGHSHP